jgi:DNA topoisomerase IA
LDGLREKFEKLLSTDTVKNLETTLKLLELEKKNQQQMLKDFEVENFEQNK